MSLMIAIIGRYGVGKSELCDQFLSHGISYIDISSILFDFFHHHEHRSIWEVCLNGHYDRLQGIIPYAPEVATSEVILSHLAHEKKNIKHAVIVLPSFIPVTHIVKSGNFSHVIAVDCIESKQKQYIEINHSDKVSSILLQSSMKRNYYVTQATDVFLNSVDKEHIGWVAGQIINTYKLCEEY